MSQIDLINLHKRYPRQRQPAVEGIHLRVEAGQLLALLGASGSGKSTLLKLIAGIEQPDSGDILLEERSILGVPAHKRAAVLMFQKAYLFPFLSVAENIAFGLKLQRRDPATIQAEVRRMLDLVELPDSGTKRPAQLSGGEQQRVALARSLIVRPRVLLLDEPLSSLDATVRQTLQEAIRRIQQELGITMILVTHDRAEALSMADQVALIEQGILLAHAPPRQLYERPATQRAARQMGIETFLCGQVEGQIFHSAFGPLCLAAPYACGHVTFAIRPEHMRLLTQPAENTLPAIMLSHSFRGEQSEYQLNVQGQQLRVRGTSQYICAVGSQLYVQLPAEHLFPVE